MTGTINSGQLVKVVAGDFDGDAGLQGDVLAYIPDRHGEPAAPGGEIAVAGVQRKVIAAERSPYVEAMVVVTLAPVEVS